MKRKILYLIPLILLGCNAEKQFNSFAIKNPDKFKSLAAVLAPCIEVNPKIDTIYKHHIDTLVTAGNTVIVTRNDTVFVTKTLPGRVITKTEVQTVTKTVADSRAVDAANIRTVTEHERVIQLTQQLADKSKAKTIWMLIAISCMALIVVGVVIKAWGLFKI